MSFQLFDIPPQCEPQNQFLASVSSLLHTCIPTPLAFTSTLLGTFSIISWLFAQLPQVIKNYRLSSTSGLSIYFLAEWCAGDITNLVGGLLTNQATWQIIIGAYYCFVDAALITQWIWYEQLHHGAKLQVMWRKTFQRRREPDYDSTADTRSIDSRSSRPSIDERRPLMPDKSAAKDVPSGTPFRPVHYGSLPSKEALSASPGSRTITRLQTGSNNSPLPSPSPRTALLICMLIALAHSSPIQPSDHHGPGHAHNRARLTAYIGTIVSWASALLYLGSRLPQILKNWRLRSTAGLSPVLFAAAFCGNFFYSASLLMNPCAWESFPAYGGRGWIRDAPSVQEDWLSAALPFFLGAAGVLAMDATVGLQFWWYGRRTGKAEQEVLVVRDGQGKGARRWREVTGWMRGWKPSIGGEQGPVLVGHS